jgi:hypothetical protein
LPDKALNSPSDIATDRVRARFGAAVWIVFACVIAVLILCKKHPTDRSVTPEYHRAAVEWWLGQPVYTEGGQGFLYMPQAAIAYTPFTFLPSALEEIVWRFAGIALYAAGTFSLCRRFAARAATGRGDVDEGTRGVLGPPGNAFFIASVLGLFAAMGSAQNGQTNLHMGGLFALAACAVIDRRWWRATLWLLLALALKPTALVMILLFGAVWWRTMSWRLAAGVVVFLLAPFAHPSPSFAWEQYGEFIDKSARAAAPTDLFQDIRGLLETLHIHLSEHALTAIRAVAAPVTLALCWLASRRFPLAVAAIFTLTLGAIYLMLFNPRTEGVTYAMIGPAAALWATREVVAKRWATAVPLIVYCLILQFSRQVTGDSNNYWVRPLTTIGFACFAAAEILAGRTRWLALPAIPPRSRETPSAPRQPS